MLNTLTPKFQNEFLLAFDKQLLSAVKALGLWTHVGGRFPTVLLSITLTARYRGAWYSLSHFRGDK